MYDQLYMYVGMCVAQIIQTSFIQDFEEKTVAFEHSVIHVCRGEMRNSLFSAVGVCRKLIKINPHTPKILPLYNFNVFK